ncbi:MULTISPECIES: YegP family protein [unclassified Acinetobacter]|uniref:YegP family protein n=1 Tax=unclassified Acinetobacter TaxID=196816 RepID=UPI0035B9EABE
MAIWFELSQSTDGQYHFSLKTETGTLLKSEAYTTKAAALNGIESVKKNAIEDKRYERKEAKNGKPMFNLKAANGQVIGTSPMYADNAALDAAIALTREVNINTETKSLLA